MRIAPAVWAPWYLVSIVGTLPGTAMHFFGKCDGSHPIAAPFAAAFVLWCLLTPWMRGRPAKPYPRWPPSRRVR